MAAKRILVQIGDALFELKYYGHIQDADHLCQLLQKYDIRLLKDKQ